jgi:hypothetical protein
MRNWQRWEEVKKQKGKNEDGREPLQIPWTKIG